MFFLGKFLMTTSVEKPVASRLSLPVCEHTPHSIPRTVRGQSCYVFNRTMPEPSMHVPLRLPLLSDL